MGSGDRRGCSKSFVCGPASSKMFLLPSKLQSSIPEEQGSPVCVKPDLNSLSIRVARLDAEVSVAVRRSAAVESMVTSAERWIDSRLAELTANLEAQMEARMETLVRQLIAQLPGGEHKLSSQVGTEAADESASSEPVKFSDSNSNGEAPKLRPRKRRGSKRRPLKSQVQAEVGICNAPGDAVGPDSSCEDVRDSARMMQGVEEREDIAPISEHCPRSIGLRTKLHVRKRAPAKHRQQPPEAAQTQIGTPSAIDRTPEDRSVPRQLSSYKPQRRMSQQVDEDIFDVV
mmetsp:Transcript_150643/g.261807  ORF Transcript_150643/g.261807 Transcript_150643/m.261807 type:complete len:287 (+) Transcript_150643:3-863(+)